MQDIIWSSFQSLFSICNTYKLHATSKSHQVRGSSIEQRCNLYFQKPSRFVFFSYLVCLSMTIGAFFSHLDAWAF